MRQDGLFIIVEGPDGVGKTTFVENLNNQLVNNGFETFVTKETTNGPIGKLIKENDFSGLLLAELQAADRLWHIENIIKPNLLKNKIVISDRFYPSSFVYQQVDGLKLETIELLNDINFIPNMSIFLFADDKRVGIRLQDRECTDRFEQNVKRKKVGKLYHEAVSYIKNLGYTNVFVFENNMHEEMMENISKLLSSIKLLVA